MGRFDEILLSWGMNTLSWDKSIRRSQYLYLRYGVVLALF